VQSVDIALTQGSIILTWPAVAGASYYNVYKAPASYDANVPIGSQFGYAGTSSGTQFTDSNITQQFTVTPPLHLNPFSRGQVLEANVVAGGSGFDQSTVGYTLALRRERARRLPIVVEGAVTGVYIQCPGEGFQNGDTMAITGGGGAIISLVIGPQSGTYPSVVGYFQQRRIYAVRSTTLIRCSRRRPARTSTSTHRRHRSTATRLLRRHGGNRSTAFNGS